MKEQLHENNPIELKPKDTQQNMQTKEHPIPIFKLRRKLIDKENGLAQFIGQIGNKTVGTFVNGVLYLRINSPLDFSLTYPLDPNNEYSEHLRFDSYDLGDPDSKNKPTYQLASVMDDETKILNPKDMTKPELEKVLKCLLVVEERLDEYHPQQS